MLERKTAAEYMSDNTSVPMEDLVMMNQMMVTVQAALREKEAKVVVELKQVDDKRVIYIIRERMHNETVEIAFDFSGKGKPKYSIHLIPSSGSNKEMLRKDESGLSEQEDESRFSEQYETWRQGYREGTKEVRGFSRDQVRSLLYDLVKFDLIVEEANDVEGNPGVLRSNSDGYVYVIAEGRELNNPTELADQLASIALCIKGISGRAGQKVGNLDKT
ncbi:hypothetical protein ACFL2V_20835 [Pseudomonadota bacterium]